MGDTWPRSSLVGISAPGLGSGSGWTIELEAGVGLMNGPWRSQDGGMRSACSRQGNH